jgi:hypothetical protein
MRNISYDPLPRQLFRLHIVRSPVPIVLGLASCKLFVCHSLFTLLVVPVIIQNTMCSLDADKGLPAALRLLGRTVVPFCRRRYVVAPCMYKIKGMEKNE